MAYSYDYYLFAVSLPIALLLHLTAGENMQVTPLPAPPRTFISSTTFNLSSVFIIEIFILKTLLPILDFNASGYLCAFLPVESGYNLTGSIIFFLKLEITNHI